MPDEKQPKFSSFEEANNYTGAKKQPKFSSFEEANNYTGESPLKKKEPTPSSSLVTPLLSTSNRLTAKQLEQTPFDEDAILGNTKSRGSVVVPINGKLVKKDIDYKTVKIPFAGVTPLNQQQEIVERRLKKLETNRINAATNPSLVDATEDREDRLILALNEDKVKVKNSEIDALEAAKQKYKLNLPFALNDDEELSNIQLALSQTQENISVRNAKLVQEDAMLGAVNEFSYVATSDYDKEIQELEKQKQELISYKNKVSDKKSIRKLNSLDDNRQSTAKVITDDNNTLDRLMGSIENMFDPFGIIPNIVKNNKYTENITLTPEFYIGLDNYAGKDKAQFERVSAQIKNGMPMSATQISQIKSNGLRLLELANNQKISDGKIEIEKFEENKSKISKSANDNLFNNYEVLRSHFASRIGEMFDNYQAGSRAKNSLKDIVNFDYANDEEIEFFGSKVAKELMLDIGDARVQRILKNLKENEGWFLMQNSIPKNNDLARNVLIGAAEPIRGLNSFVQQKINGSDDESLNELYVEGKSLESNTMGEQRTERGKEGAYSVILDAAKGAGSFASQLGLSYGVSGVLGKAGALLSNVGKVGTVAANAETAALIAADEFGLASLAEEAAGGSIFRNAAGKAIIYSKDALSTAITSYPQSYVGNLQTAMGYTSNNEDAKNIARMQTLVDTSTELFLSPLEVGKRINKNLFKNEGVKNALLEILKSKNVLESKNILQKALKKSVDMAVGAGDVVLSEIGEELVSKSTDLALNAYYSTDTFKNREVGAEMLETVIQTGLAMAIPVILSGAGAAKSNSFSKQTLLLASENRLTMLDQLSRLRYEGKIDEKEHDQKALIINTSAEAVASLDAKENSKSFTKKQREDYVHNHVSEAILKAQIEEKTPQGLPVLTNAEIAKKKEKLLEIENAQKIILTQSENNGLSAEEIKINFLNKKRDAELADADASDYDDINKRYDDDIAAIAPVITPANDQEDAPKIEPILTSEERSNVFRSITDEDKQDDVIKEYETLLENEGEQKASDYLRQFMPQSEVIASPENKVEVYEWNGKKIELNNGVATNVTNDEMLPLGINQLLKTEGKLIETKTVSQPITNTQNTGVAEDISQPIELNPIDTSNTQINTNEQSQNNNEANRQEVLGGGQETRNENEDGKSGEQLREEETLTVASNQSETPKAEEGSGGVGGKGLPKIINEGWDKITPNKTVQIAEPKTIPLKELKGTEQKDAIRKAANNVKKGGKPYIIDFSTNNSWQHNKYILTDVNKRYGFVEVDGDNVIVTPFKVGDKFSSTEQSIKETTKVGSSVEKTAKALEDKFYSNSNRGNAKVEQLQLIDLIPNETVKNPELNGFYKLTKYTKDEVDKLPKSEQERIAKLQDIYIDRNRENIIAEIYHADKALGKETDLTKAVEKLLSNNPETKVEAGSVKEITKAETTTTTKNNNNGNEQQVQSSTGSEQDSEIPTSTRDKAESDNEVELNEAIQEADAIILETGVQTATVPTKDIIVAPKVFQYKASINESGTNANEQIQDKFNKNDAGTIGVWRDVKNELGNGANKVYVVDGHHRTERAMKDGVENMNVFFIDAPTAKDAMIIAARTNIKQGKGTSIDAAKVIRENPYAMKGLIAPNSKVAKEGQLLSKLNDTLFEEVSTGGLSMKAAIALSNVSKENQDKIRNTVAKYANNPTANQDRLNRYAILAERGFENGNVEKKVVAQLGMFGEEFEVDTQAMAEVQSEIVSNLKDDARLLNSASRNADILENANSQIDTEATANEGQKSKLASALFDKQINEKGTREIFDKTVAEWKNAKTKAEKDAIIKKATEAVKNEILKNQATQFSAEAVGTETTYTTAAQKTLFNNVVKWVKSVIGKDNIASAEEYYEVLEKLDIDSDKLEKIEKNGVVKGFVYKGKIYLNPNSFNPTTPLHELGHIWQKGLRTAAKEGNKEAVEFLKRFDSFKLFERLNKNRRATINIGNGFVSVNLSSNLYAQGENESNKEYKERIDDEIMMYLMQDKMLEKFEKASSMEGRLIKNFFKKINDFFSTLFGVKGKLDWSKETLEDLIDKGSNSILKQEFLNFNNNKEDAFVSSQKIDTDANGNMFVIDPVISIDTSDRGYEGTRIAEFPNLDFEDTDNENIRFSVSENKPINYSEKEKQGINKADRLRAKGIKENRIRETLKDLKYTEDEIDTIMFETAVVVEQKSIKDRIVDAKEVTTDTRLPFSAQFTFAEAGIGTNKSTPATYNETSLPSIVLAKKNLFDQINEETNGNAMMQFADYFKVEKNKYNSARKYDVSGYNEEDYKMANALIGILNSNIYTYEELGITAEQATKINKGLQDFSAAKGKQFGVALNSARITNVITALQEDLLQDNTLSDNQKSGKEEFGNFVDSLLMNELPLEPKYELKNGVMVEVLGNTITLSDDEQMLDSESDIDTLKDEIELEKQAEKQMFLSKYINFMKKESKLKKSQERSKHIIDKMGKEVTQIEAKMKDLLNKINCK